MLDSKALASIPTGPANTADPAPHYPWPAPYTSAMFLSFDVDALVRVAERAFSPDEVAALTTVQSKAFRHTFLLSGMTHPNFVKTISELSSTGAARVAVLAQAFA